MSKKVKALFVVVTLSATFIILFQTCVITLDPRSCPLDMQRQYLNRYSNAFPLSLTAARAPLWIHERNSTDFANLTQALNEAALLKLNGLLQPSVDTQLTLLKLNSSAKPSGTGSNNKDGSIVPGELLASMEQTTSHPSISTYVHTVVTEESPQSMATFPVELTTKDHNVVFPQPHANDDKTEKLGSIKSSQNADTQSDAVGNPVIHPRPSLHLPHSAFLKQLQTHNTVQKQQGTLLVQPHTQRTSLSQPQMQRTSTMQPHQIQRTSQKKRRSERRNSVLLSATLPTSVSPALNLSSISYLPLPRIGTYVCQDRLCTEVLTPVDLLYFNYCTDRQKHARTEIYRDMPLGKCHFTDGRNRTTVALVSFPGSGNTWVRGLLEQATGVCTGSIYCDVSLRASGFNGEGVKSGVVTVVKTHRPVPQWTESNTSTINERGAPKYGSGIVVIRNPFDALVAEWNREKSSKNTIPSGNGTNSHVNCVGRGFFGENAEWNEHITRKIYVWQNYFYNWLLNNMSKPILVVRFEDLKTDLIGQVKRMLDFLQFPYLEDELRSRLAEGFGKFHRVHDGDDFKHFTAKQQVLIRTVVLETIETLRRHKQKNLLGLTDYLFSNL